MAVKQKYTPTDDQLAFFTTGGATESLPDEKSEYAQGVSRGITRGGEEVRKDFSFIPSILSKTVDILGVPEETQQMIARQHSEDLFGPGFQKEVQRVEEEPGPQGLGPQFIENTITRAMKMAPYAAMGLGMGAPVGGEMLRLGSASVLGGALETADAPEEIQTLGEMFPYLLPGLAKQIPAKGDSNIPARSQAGLKEEDQLVQFARQQGLSEEEIALAREKPGKFRRTMAKLGRPSEKLKQTIEGTKQSLGNVYNSLRQSPEAQQAGNVAQRTSVRKNLSDSLAELPAESRKVVFDDYRDFLSSEMTGSDVINFWQDINQNIEKHPKLGRLKADVEQYMTNISPEMGYDFKLTNKLWGNFKDVAQRLSPGSYEAFYALGEAGAMLQGIATGNTGLMKKVLGAVGGRELARELAANPRLQKLSTRFVKALDGRKPAVAKQLYERLVNYVAGVDPDAGSKLAEFDVDEFYEQRDALKNQKSE